MRGFLLEVLELLRDYRTPKDAVTGA